MVQTLFEIYKLLHLASYYPSQHISRYNNLQYSIHFLRSTFYSLFLLFAPLRSYCKYYDLYVFDYLMLFLKDKAGIMS